MNGNENDVDIESVNPSWMEDGFGIVGEQSDPDFSDDTQWPAEAWSRMNDEREDIVAPGGLTVTDGTHTVHGVTTISFDPAVFLVVDYGGGEAHIQCA